MLDKNQNGKVLWCNRLWKNYRNKTIVEKKYYGDILRKTFKSQQSGQVLDDINISNEISIIADAFAYENFQSMRYITFMKCKWKITNAEIQYPRLILTVGGLYNENQT